MYRVPPERRKLQPIGTPTATFKVGISTQKLEEKVELIPVFIKFMDIFTYQSHKT